MAAPLVAAALVAAPLVAAAAPPVEPYQHGTLDVGAGNVVHRETSAGRPGFPPSASTGGPQRGGGGRPHVLRP